MSGRDWSPCAIEPGRDCSYNVIPSIPLSPELADGYSSGKLCRSEWAGDAHDSVEEFSGTPEGMERACPEGANLFQSRRDGGGNLKSRSTRSTGPYLALNRRQSSYSSGNCVETAVSSRDLRPVLIPCDCPCCGWNVLRDVVWGKAAHTRDRDPNGSRPGRT
jgi:hypothetical protein